MSTKSPVQGMTFGVLLRTLLDATHCTANALAKELNYSPSLIGKWVAETSLPNRNRQGEIIRKTAACLVSQMLENNRNDQMMALLSLDPSHSSHVSLLESEIANLLNRAYQRQQHLPVPEIGISPYRLYEDPETLLRGLSKTLRERRTKPSQAVLRICSNVPAEELNLYTAVLCDTLPNLDTCCWHHVIPKSKDAPWVLQSLSETMHTLISCQAINRFYYTFAKENTTSAFLYIEDLGTILQIYLPGKVLYQWLPVSHDAALLQQVIEGKLAYNTWHMGLQDCDLPDFEAQMHYFTLQEGLIAASIPIPHFMMAMVPDYFTEPMSLTSTYYLRFLRSLTHQMQATCIFHSDSVVKHASWEEGTPSTAQNLRLLSETIADNWHSRDNNRYYFSSGGSRSPLKPQCLWLVSPNRAMMLFIHPSTQEPSHYLMLSGSVAEMLYEDIRTRPNLHDSLALPAEVVQVILRGRDLHGR